MPEPLIIALGEHAPELHDTAWVAPNATVIGQVKLSAKASVWYGATLRAEVEPIEIGAGANIQDGVTVHVDPGFPPPSAPTSASGTRARIGRGSLVAAGAVVAQGVEVPPGSLVAGYRQGRRELSAQEVDGNRTNALLYQHLVDVHRQA
jgi:carbonic anhydrase/acetyltransferase-like protein (isoleucine patch superfamily)